jgi:hypothetical protein
MVQIYEHIVNIRLPVTENTAYILGKDVYNFIEIGDDMDVYIVENNESNRNDGCLYEIYYRAVHKLVNASDNIRNAFTEGFVEFAADSIGFINCCDNSLTQDIYKIINSCDNYKMKILKHGDCIVTYIQKPTTTTI